MGPSLTWFEIELLLEGEETQALLLLYPLVPKFISPSSAWLPKANGMTALTGTLFIIVLTGLSFVFSVIMWINSGMPTSYQVIWLLAGHVELFYAVVWDTIGRLARVSKLATGIVPPKYNPFGRPSFKGAGEPSLKVV